MCAASVLVVYESLNTIVNYAQFFTQKNTTKTLSEIDMSAFPISTIVVTIITKAVLFFLCYRVKTPTMSALAADHRNDVFSNLVALACGLIGRCERTENPSEPSRFASGSYAYKNRINQRAIFVDPIGAILISIYIIITWIRQANSEQHILLVKCNLSLSPSRSGQATEWPYR